MSAGPSEVLPDKGLVFAETEDLTVVLCKPKILPIKSFSLERLERLEKKMQEEQKQRREREKAEKKAGGWSSGVGLGSSSHVTPPALTVPARAARPGPPIPVAPTTASATPAAAHSAGGVAASETSTPTEQHSDTRESSPAPADG